MKWKSFDLHRYTGKFNFVNSYYLGETGNILDHRNNFSEAATFINKQGQGQCEEIPNKKF